MGEIIKAVTQGLETIIEQGIAIKKAGSTVVFASEDAKEGSRAFLEKRRANFQGK